MNQKIVSKGGMYFPMFTLETLTLLAFLVIIVICLPEPKHIPKTEALLMEERDQVLKFAEIQSRRVRYETRALGTRIKNIINKVFDSYAIIENLILMDEVGIEHQIPLLCATNKGVILFQLVDYPGKGLFGDMHEEEWRIAQSADIAQAVPNAAVAAIENAMMIKRLTGIDVKPIAVVSKYTPTVARLISRRMGLRLILEENLERELEDMARYGKQSYPEEFMCGVKDKLRAMHVSDDEDEDAGEEAIVVIPPETDEDATDDFEDIPFEELFPNPAES